MYENPNTGSNEFEEIADTIIPIIPHSWYHICMGLDTVSGLLRIVVNGKEVVNKEKEYFSHEKALLESAVAASPDGASTPLEASPCSADPAGRLPSRFRMRTQPPGQHGKLAGSSSGRPLSGWGFTLSPGRKEKAP